jgi:ubiquinone/menaquinone biosynthesis C-methylase UbiE
MVGIYKKNQVAIMKEQNSYNIQQIGGDTGTEINRLKSQVELFWSKEMKHYREFGLADGMSVVELGCGPGFVMEKLLREFKNLSLTGVEIDSYLVDFASGYMKQLGADAKILEGSILDTGLPGNSFDCAITRLVLEHLPDPVAAVKEVLRILRPNGKAIFVDNDFEMHIMTFPNIPELKELYDAYCRSRSDEGGHPKIGRQLPVILGEGGFSNIDYEVICAHSGILGDDMFFRSEGVGIPTKLVRDGYLSSKVLGKISVQWREMIQRNDHAIIRQLYMAAGEKTIDN